MVAFVIESWIWFSVVMIVAISRLYVSTWTRVQLPKLTSAGYLAEWLSVPSSASKRTNTL